MDSDYLKILQRGLDELEIEYQPSQLEKTQIYLGLLKKWNKKYQAPRQKETAAKHRPKTPDTRDTKSYCRNSKKYPSEEINCLIFHLSHFIDLFLFAARGNL